LKLHLHHFSKIKSQKESQNSMNQGFSYYFCMIIEGSGSRSGRPKNVWIRWIRIWIRNTAADYPAPYHTRSTTFPACPTAYSARPAAFPARPTVHSYIYEACQSLLFNHNLPSNYRHLRYKLMPACIFKCCQKSLFRANDFVHSEQLKGFSTL
jgi:hypothetical protein